ncbi:Glycosyltransferase [hydrothermal vent metagenome]|uniref:Glycosyltransferase n=1 Tax=hydrothermal vent metagenome TaxID=652676 RepID=A0A3B0UQV9_9ZZZZ
MKILYAIQGTGNGHVARATEIVPLLKEMAETDVLVSGVQSDLTLPFKVDYSLYGLSFIFGKTGGVDIKGTVSRMKLIRLIKDIYQLPVDKYDLIINDFEPVSAWACLLRDKQCIGLSHQNAVIHPEASRPAVSGFPGKLILKNYAPATIKYGFHFDPVGHTIFTPVIRPAIYNAKPTNKGHYTVYLPAYSDEDIISTLSKVKHIEWKVFSKHSKKCYSRKNVTIRPVSLEGFSESLISCAGVLCTAGFETPAEVLYLGKKLCVIPMKNQYEQSCNAASLENIGVKVLKRFSGNSPEIAEWANDSNFLHKSYTNQTKEILKTIVYRHSYCNFHRYYITDKE